MAPFANGNHKGRGGRKFGHPRTLEERQNQSKAWQENEAKGKHLKLR